MKAFDWNNSRLTGQFREPVWRDGLSPEELEAACRSLEADLAGQAKALIKAKTFALIAEKSRIAVDSEDIFQDKLFGGGIMERQRRRWQRAVTDAHFPEAEAMAEAFRLGAYRSDSDFGHTSPDSRALLKLGIPGLLARLREAASREGLSPEQKDFYAAGEMVLEAMLTVMRRLADGVRPVNPENAAALDQLVKGAPRDLYEAMQLIIVYFFLHEYVAGTRVRTLGRLDVLLWPYYQRDLESGRYTEAEIDEMLRFFLHKFYAADVPFGLPFCLGGRSPEGGEVTNALSLRIVEIFDSMNIHSPKLHIRVSDDTPKDFIKRVLAAIRGGSSSFVLISDNIAVQSLMRVGITREDALDYVPIGCYEPAVWGREIGCTGNGGVNLAKAVELVFTGGRDHATGRMLGPDPGEIDSWEAFVSAVKAQIRHMSEKAMAYITAIEAYYGEIGPDPILSVQYEEAVGAGRDVYEGGARYNNSSFYFWCIATLVDSMAAVKRLVFEEKRIGFHALGEILKANWEGQEILRRIARKLPEKYGNNNETADAVFTDLAEFCAALVNNRPNGRGGVFKAACFSIDRCFSLGKVTMATPDGRLAGEPLSKNLCASVGMDKNGLTALITSVTKMDHAAFPNGSVLDVVLHPSAVAGEDGLEAFYAAWETYRRRGGYAMHGNVFDAELLRRAQEKPEDYAGLQVRVCGWNARFVNLSRVEQDSFIRQAENRG